MVIFYTRVALLEVPITPECPHNESLTFLFSLTLLARFEC